VVSTWQKPIKLILRFILLHGRPDWEDPDKGTATAQRPWVMDAGCGSGTASIAAILLGMNCYAFDEKQLCVDGTMARLTDWTNHLVDSDMAPTEEITPGARKKKRKSMEADQDDDLLSGDVQAANKTVTDDEIQAIMDEVGESNVAVGEHLQPAEDTAAAEEDVEVDTEAGAEEERP
jgi:hypothetical protein